MEKQKILVVDDDETTRKMLVDILQKEYDCIAHPNGLKAMEWLEEHENEADIVVTDIVMPMMDGFELLDYIQKIYTGVPPFILVITSYEDQDKLQKALLLGAQEVISKPFDPLIIKKRIENMLALKETRELHNVMEDIIKAEIDSDIEAFGICPCPVCRKDLLTLALNNVKPKYVSTEKGAVLTKVDNMSSSNQLELVKEIARCAQIVKANPHHD